MPQRVVLSLGNGDLNSGFPTVTAHLWKNENPYPMKFVGSLPPCPQISQLYRSWQLMYQALHHRLDWHPRIEIEAADVTNVSQVEFSDICQQLSNDMNRWLNLASFRSIDQSLRTQLNTLDEIRVLVETNDRFLQKLPWHLWNLLEDYPNAEVALSALQYQSSQPLPKTRNRTRILVILGNGQGVDLNRDRTLLEQLSDTATLEFLVEPSREALNYQLWQPWDLLFFAGHSSSQDQGVIQINATDSLTLEQLRYALKRSIAEGLQLAFFNSCDGLGLANQLADLHIPQVIVMREPIADVVAHRFLEHFLMAFTGGRSLYASVREARERLQGIEAEFPCASWLPIICQNPATPTIIWHNGQLLAETETTRQRVSATSDGQLLAKTKATGQDKSSGSVRWPQRIAVFASIATILVVGGRWLGLLQTLELQALDHFMRQKPSEERDSRLLIVTVTEEDLQLPVQQQRQGSLSNLALTQLLDRLTAYQPRVIGLDIFRDYAIAPQETALANHLRRSNLFAVCKVSIPEANHPGIAPPPGVPSERQGFSAIVQDADGVLRRHLLGMEPSPASPCTTAYALSIQLAMHYLKAAGVSAQFTPDENLQIGSVIFKRLRSHTGGYHRADTEGYQILLNYRSYRSPLAIAPTVTLRDVLSGKLQPDQVKDRIVLIGVTAPSFHDYHSTPYSVGQELHQQMPGVIVQAQMVSQIVSAVKDGRPLLESWPFEVDAIWIGVWAIVGGCIAWRWRSLPYLIFATGSTIAVLYAICFVLFLSGRWVPFVPSVLALVLVGSGVTYVQYQQHLHGK